MGPHTQNASSQKPSTLARNNAYSAALRAKTVSEYYHSFETRAGYWALLGRRKHWGYYEPGTRWPFPITRALKRMEAKLAEAIDRPAGSRVLDAGCGDGLVAVQLTQTKAWRIDCIDIVDRQIARTKQLFKANGLPESAVRKMDYHDLTGIEDNTYDAVYAMETLPHGDPFEKVMSELYRVTKPGGVIVHHGYEMTRVFETEPWEGFYELSAKFTKWGAMPRGDLLYRGAWRDLTEGAGFKDVEEYDYTENIKPLVYMAYLLALIPSFIVTLFGLEEYFLNTVGMVYSYRCVEKGFGHYIQIKGRKPLNA